MQAKTVSNVYLLEMVDIYVKLAATTLSIVISGNFFFRAARVTLCKFMILEIIKYLRHLVKCLIFIYVNI